jgi:glycosyltransferase involved in cell wall biosynthesis
LHPRTFHIPGVARFLNAVFYTMSVAPFVRAEVARFRPDVILAPWVCPDGTAAVALGQATGVPVVVRAMGSDINQVAHTPGRRSQVRWTLRHAGRVVAVSRALGDAIACLGVPDEKIAVIPTGVESTIFHPHDRAAARATLGLGPGPLVLAAARLSPEKGLMHLLAALSIHRGQFQLVVVGDGAQRRELEQEVHRRSLRGRVRFEGFQSEARMPLYYSAADLFCLPSLAEGWPDALMESFACGCPAVASAVGGVPDIMALTEAGLTVPAADPEALARALGQALARDWDRPAIARTMADHTMAATARRYLDVCQDAISTQVPT